MNTNELESAILGAVILDSTAFSVISDKLFDGLFQNTANKLIYNALTGLDSKTAGIDLISLVSELMTQGKLDLVGGAVYIASLTDRVNSSGNLEYWVTILSQQYMKRESIKLANEIIRHAKDPKSDALEVVSLFDKASIEINGKVIQGKGLLHISEVGKGAVMELAERISDRNEGKFTGIDSGDRQYNEATNGHRRGDLVILAARPAMGKTLLAMTDAKRTSEQKHNVLVFSLEMTSKDLYTRIALDGSDLEGMKVEKGEITTEGLESFANEYDRIKGLSLYIDDNATTTVQQIRAKALRKKAELGSIEVIIIDYLQLLEAPSKGLNDTQKATENSRRLKLLAKELDCAVICLSQLSRAVEIRGGNKEPILSDLRDSGAIEQDADIVIFCYRPDYYGITEDEEGNSVKGQIRRIFAKHRKGGLPTLLNHVDLSKMRITPWEQNIIPIESNEPLSIPPTKSKAFDKRSLDDVKDLWE
jgi:replicative DNA helicase